MDTADAFGSLFDEIPAPDTQQRTAGWAEEPSYNGEPFAIAGPNTPYTAPGTMTRDFVVPPPAPTTIDDNPEAALPVTYGDEDDMAARVAAGLNPPLTAPSPTPVLAGVQHVSLTREAGFPLCAKGCNWTLSADSALINTTAGLAHAQCPTATVASIPAPVAVASVPAAPAAPPMSEEERGRRALAYADAVARGETPAGPNPFDHWAGAEVDNDTALAAQQYLAKTNPQAQPGLQTEALRTYDPAERQAIIDEGIEVRAGNLDRLDIKGTHYEALVAAGREDEDLTFLDGDPNDF